MRAASRMWTSAVQPLWEECDPPSPQRYFHTQASQTPQLVENYTSRLYSCLPLNVINQYEVAHGIMNYQNRGLCYLPKPKAEADNTATQGLDNS